MIYRVPRRWFYALSNFFFDILKGSKEKKRKTKNKKNKAFSLTNFSEFYPFNPKATDLFPSLEKKENLLLALIIFF